MEKCKFCQAELAENGTFCPNCGKDNAAAEAPVEETAAVQVPVVEENVTAEQEMPAAEQTPAEEPKKATPTKIALAVAAVVVLIAVLIAMIVPGMTQKAEDPAAAADPTAVTEEIATVPTDGNPDDVTCKGTYTVSDEQAVAEKNAVVATLGDAELTNAQLRIYYRSAVSSFLSTEYGYMMMMYGALDYAKPLDTQLTMEGDKTWQQFFIQYALDNWQLTQSLAQEAAKNGFEMRAEDKDYLSTMRASMEELAVNHGMTVEDMLTSDFGAGVTYEDFQEYQTLYLQGSPYYDAEVEKFVATEDVLEAYFKENEETYAAAGVTMDSKFVDVRHILVQVKGGFSDVNGNMTHTDEEWATCEADAQAILDAWLSGEKTEESFAALANEKSEDPGSNTNGGLYEDVYMGQMVEPFETWCFDENRQYGDYGLVKTSYGYHVMFYVGNSPMWKQYAEGDWKNDQVSQLLKRVVENYPMEVTYENISLGEVNMA